MNRGEGTGFSGIREGDAVEIGQFGYLSYWVGGNAEDIERRDLNPLQKGGKTIWRPAAEGGDLGFEWDWPRHVYRLEVTYISSQEAPSPEDVAIQYWHNTWPAENRGHWTSVDDAWNGRWVEAQATPQMSDNRVAYTFDPLDVTELSKAEDFAVFYRKTLKIRLVYGASAPSIQDVRVYSDSVWRRSDVDVIFAGDSLDLKKCRATVYNGLIESVAPKGDRLHIVSWYASDRHGEGELTTAGTYADHAYVGRWPYDGGSPNRTTVTVHGPASSASFLPGDVAAGQVIDLPDLGVTVRPADREEVQGRYGVGSEVDSATSGRSIYEMVEDETEQSYERATKEIPALAKTKQRPWGRYVCLGCDANRQEFALRFNGHIYLNKRELKVNRRDTAKLLWPGMELRYMFGTGDPPDFREREDGTRQRLLDGYLPVVVSEWWDRGIAYEQTAFAALIDETPWNEPEKRGDEPSILLLRFVLRNTTPETRPARIWFVVEPGEYLTYDDGYIQAAGRFVPDNTVQHGWRRSPYETPRLRAYLASHGRGTAKPILCPSDSGEVRERAKAEERVAQKNEAIVYEVELKGRETHTIEFKIPFETYTSASDRERSAMVDYDTKFKETVEYWSGLVGGGIRLDLPEEIVSDFQKAVIPHIAITVDKDVDSGLYMVPAGTYRYNVCSNEACMQIHMLDLLGHHSRARAYLETFLKCQGTRPLHGRFKTQQGALHGLRVSDNFDYQTFNYNLDHGWVMYTCAEHYWLTGDKEWLEKWAQNLVDAADFIVRERQSTMQEKNGERVWEYGLFPAGHLEDNPEWFYWYSVNGYTWRGIQAVGEVLADIGHPEGPRILNEAAAYKDDIVRAVCRSMIHSPVVPLRNGAFIPHVPTRAYLRGRDMGWIRENLYGPMHLIETGIFDDTSQEADWILEDYEDNLFVNPAYGRFVDVERDWFSQGGMTIQAHLMYNCLVYLRRDQIKHAIRAYYNSLVSHLYPDVRCFTEHAVRELGSGVGPFYKTPDEAGSVTWLRHFLVHEQGDGLRLGWAVPRPWLSDGKLVKVERAATHFGPVGYTIESRVNDGEIEVTLTPPTRRTPEFVDIRLRHPEALPIADVTVEGTKSYEVVGAKEYIRLRDWRSDVRMVVRY